MSGLALPQTKSKPSPSPSGNAVAGPSKRANEDAEEETDKQGRKPKAVVGVPEITAVAGLVPTLQ
jgi:transcription initiation factor TFIID TATA-box-binding protein